MIGRTAGVRAPSLPDRVIVFLTPALLVLSLALAPSDAGAQTSVPVTARPDQERARDVGPLAPDLRLAAFERRRARGRGAFITSETLRRRRGARVSDLLRQMPGVALVPLAGSGHAVAAARAGIQPSLHRDPTAPSACFVDVFLDGSRLTAGPTIMPLDIDAIAPARLAAIEFHRAPSIPADFPLGATSCGVLALWSEP